MDNKEYLELVAKKIDELKEMRTVGQTLPGDISDPRVDYQRALIRIRLLAALQYLELLLKELQVEWPQMPRGGVKVTISLPENWEERENLPGFATGEGRD
jgi:hypothetical protein